MTHLMGLFHILKKHVSHHHPQELKKWIADVTWQTRTLKVCTKHVRKGLAQAFLPSQFFLVL
jgi:hypothetical protein